MSTFLLIAVLGTALALVAILWPLFAGRSGATARAEKDAAVFRDQLAELERDRARGAVSEADHAGTKAEISRRLIAATDRAERGSELAPASRGRSRRAAIAWAVVVPAVTLAIYAGPAQLWQSLGIDPAGLERYLAGDARDTGLAGLVTARGVGSPQLPDLPFAGRQGRAASGQLSQAEAEAMQPERPPAEIPPGDDGQDYAVLIAPLEEIVTQRSDDPEGRRLLSNGYMRLNRYGDAWRSYASLIELLGADADADLYATQAEAMVLAAGGYVSPEARAVLAQALLRSPGQPVARYYQGIALAQADKLEEAVAMWQGLRAESPADARWLPALDRMLERARIALGETVPGVPAAPGAPRVPGPGQAEIEAAARMAPEERQEMIAGMVARLDARLAEEGGTGEEWFRLLNAYVQLGRLEDARRVYARSQEALSGQDAGALRQQALILGIISE